jgi:tRNA uridine 5-carbamoylmethylation protein Kti12
MKETIYIGEVLNEVLQPHMTIKIGNSTNTLFTHSTQNDTESVAIDTSEWQSGYYSVVYNNNGELTISTLTVIDPMAQADRLTELQTQLDDINSIITARINGDTHTLTINNKTLIKEDLNTLINLKNNITKQVNDLKRKLTKGSTGFFKSTIHCR